MSALSHLPEPHPFTDRRQAPRARVYISVHLFADHNFWTGLSMDLSEGGVFVATHTLLPVGSQLMLHMTLPFENEPIVVTAHVRWTRAHSELEGVAPGLGLQFSDLDALGRASIRWFVRTVREPLLFEDLDPSS